MWYRYTVYCAFLKIFQGNLLFAFVHSFKKIHSLFEDLKFFCTLSLFLIFLILVYTLFPRFILALGVIITWHQCFIITTDVLRKLVQDHLAVIQWAIKESLRYWLSSSLFCFCFEFYFLLENSDKTSFSW